MARKSSGQGLGSTVRYIPCQVEPGMFQGEWLVYLDVAGPGNPEQPVRAQVLVDQRLVKGVQGSPNRNAPAPAWLRVELADTRNGFAVVVLPQPAQPVGATVFIDQGRVRQDPGG
jgi:hypothetical protein